MFPIRCIQPPCRNIEVKMVALGGTTDEVGRELVVAEQH